jgi:hypothetical protein
LYFAFENQALDVDRRELRRGSELIAIEPQVFDLLVYLLRNRDRVVSKDDLIAGVWGGRIVSESTLDSRINAVRKALRRRCPRDRHVRGQGGPCDRPAARDTFLYGLGRGSNRLRARRARTAACKSRQLAQSPRI